MRSSWNILGLLLLCTANVSGEEDSLPPFSEVEKTVLSYFQANREHRNEDLISRAQVTEVLQRVKKLGWEIPDQKKLLDSVLEDQHVLVQTMRTPAGRRFLSKVGSRDMIYDRLDRISGVSGGPELIRDLVKLPNGEKYAKPRSGGGVPDLLDLLPKNASGKTRRIANYDSATGHIYTASDLVAHLSEIHEECLEDAAVNAAAAAVQ